MQLRASLIPQQVRNGRAGLYDNARRFPSPSDIRVPLPCEYDEGEARFDDFSGEDGGGGVVQDRGACGPAETCQYRDGRVLYAQQDEGERATRDGGGSAVDGTFSRNVTKRYGLVQRLTAGLRVFLKDSACAPKPERRRSVDVASPECQEPEESRNAAPIPRLAIAARPTAVFTFSEHSDDFALYRPLCPSRSGPQQATAAVLVVVVGCPTRPDVSSDFFARASRAEGARRRQGRRLYLLRHRRPRGTRKKGAPCSLYDCPEKVRSAGRVSC